MSTALAFDLEASREAGGSIAGVAVGIVKANDDPDGLGRVKLSLPWRQADFITDWVRILAPMGGKDRGICFLPEVDDEVLVAFDRNDIRYAFANGKDIDNERSFLPSAKALEPSFPSALTPFTYLGADAVGEGQRGMLSAVSAHRSEPLADGWMLQPVAALDDAPPAGFLSDCEAIAGHALRYLRPLTGRK